MQIAKIISEGSLVCEDKKTMRRNFMRAVELFIKRGQPMYLVLKPEGGLGQTEITIRGDGDGESIFVGLKTTIDTR